MSSRPYIIHQVSTTQPTGQQLGDEWYDPVTNRLYKQVAQNGNTVTAAEVVLNTGNPVSFVGNVSAQFFIGNGSLLTGISALTGRTDSVNPFVTALGDGALVVNTGADNTAVGSLALNANTNGINNTAVGRQAMLNTSAGSDNVAVGRQALQLNTFGSNNTAMGSNALTFNTTGTENTAVGRAALFSNTFGSFNTAVGRSALASNTTGINNTAVGRDALLLATTGTSNTAVGRAAMLGNTFGEQNTAMGHEALTLNTTGGFNTAVGRSAMFSNTTGVQNTAIGWQALSFNTTGNNNVAVGFNSLRDNTIGINNTAIGWQALLANTTGTQNTAVGQSAGSNITFGSNNIVIGMASAASSATVSNENTFGGASTTSNRFWGDMKMAGTNAGTSGTMLVSSGAGVAPTWVNQITGLGVGTPASATTGEIRAINNITAFFSSDKKFKTNIKPIENALSIVEAVGGKTFDWTDEYIASHGGEDAYFVQKSDFGIIAQDIQRVFPQAVRVRPDGTLAVDYEKLVAVAFQAIVELQAQVDQLQQNRSS